MSGVFVDCGCGRGIEGGGNLDFVIQCPCPEGTPNLVFLLPDEKRIELYMHPKFFSSRGEQKDDDAKDYRRKAFPESLK